MENLGAWVWVSVPIYFALTSGLKGRTRSGAFWVYSWLLAGLIGYTTLHHYKAWSALASSGFMSASGRAGLLHLLWLYGAITVTLLVLPVAWFRHDCKKERADGGASLSA